MNEESRPKAAPKDLAGGLISSNSPTNRTVSHARRNLSEFYAARDKIAQARDAARARARAEGRPIRPAEVDEQLRTIDDVIALDDGEAVGND